MIHKPKLRIWDVEKRTFIEGEWDHSLWYFLKYPKKFTVQEYIGVKDRTGKEIFSGDIVNHAMIGEAVVVYDPTCCAFVLKQDITTPMGNGTSNFYTVVGHAYDLGRWRFKEIYES